VLHQRKKALVNEAPSTPDPFETWATEDFCSAKALFVPLR
jgi:hypothetical protein